MKAASGFRSTPIALRAECGGLEHGDTAAAEAVEDNIPLAGVVLNHMSEDVVGTPRKILVHFVLRRVSLGSIDVFRGLISILWSLSFW